MCAVSWHDAILICAVGSRVPFWPGFLVRAGGGGRGGGRRRCAGARPCAPVRAERARAALAARGALGLVPSARTRRRRVASLFNFGWAAVGTRRAGKERGGGRWCGSARNGRETARASLARVSPRPTGASGAASAGRMLGVSHERSGAWRRRRLGAPALRVPRPGGAGAVARDARFCLLRGECHGPPTEAAPCAGRMGCDGADTTTVLRVGRGLNKTGERRCASRTL